jgi:hypothetical protein
MTAFNFDSLKRFPDNSAAFLESVKDIDPAMASILENNWDKLLDVVIKGERNTRARADFNEAIVIALDGLLSARAEEEGK